ncbi:hypothetical protein [Heyndrickxia acidiproducens]|uniref:hypothetical protein n=1 Tax=Heyndrickxia acidiproducens TaxID=1121084 RepID=UPI0003647301|nr:hypothetical protein [Heyndrickxia acidiproducens]
MRKWQCCKLLAKDLRRKSKKYTEDGHVVVRTANYYYTLQARHTFKGPNLGAYRAVHERITAKKQMAEPEGEENVIL